MPRWNDELKVYTAKIYTAEQAIMIREAQKMVSAEDEADLANALTDEEIVEVFDFPEAKPAAINIIAEFAKDGEDTIAIGGTTYPWKDTLTEKGFKFDRVDTHMWHAPVGTETDELESMFEEYGFNVEYYDDAVAEE